MGRYKEIIQELQGDLWNGAEAAIIQEHIDDLVKEIAPRLDMYEELLEALGWAIPCAIAHEYCNRNEDVEKSTRMVDLLERANRDDG